MDMPRRAETFCITETVPQERHLARLFTAYQASSWSILTVICDQVCYRGHELYDPINRCRLPCLSFGERPSSGEQIYRHVVLMALLTISLLLLLIS